MKRILSVLITITMLVGAMPVLATNEFDDIDISAESPLGVEDVTADITPTEVAQNEVYYEPNTSMVEDKFEPIVHTETLPNDIKISEEEFNLMGNTLPNATEISLFSTLSGNTDNRWEEMFTQQFGGDYLKPFEKKEDGQTVSGNTNRLTIEETDLRLSGKNGFDFVLKRRHDNQDYSEAYTAVYDRPPKTYQYKCRVTFKNTRTNGKINVAFYTIDDFYAYMYSGSRLTAIDTNKLQSYSTSADSFSFYNFSYIETLMTDNTAYDFYEYDDSVDIKTFYDTHEETSLYSLESRRVLANRNRIGNDQYSLFVNNCSQVVMDGINKGKVYNGTNAGAFTNYYRGLIPNETKKY